MGQYIAYIGYIKCLGYTGYIIYFIYIYIYILYAQDTYLLWNESIGQRKHKRGGGENQDLNGIQLKSPDLDKNMISPDVPCGHFALGTLSETCLKDVVV